MKKFRINKKIVIATLGVIAIIFSIIILYFNNKSQVETEKFSVTQGNTTILGGVLGTNSDSIKKAVDEIKTEIKNQEAEVLEQEEKVQETKIAETKVQAPKSGRVIVIDPGHSLNPAQGTEPQAPGSSIMKAKDVSGAFSTNAGYGEYLLNQQIADLLKVDLERRGFTVIMTKSNINQSIGNIDRAEVGNNANADLVIRIHADSYDNSSAKGASMLVPAANNQYTSAIAQISSKYGQTILNSFTSSNPINNRGLVVSDTMTGFNWSRVPVVLLEMGFLSNPEDEAYLINGNNHGKIVEGIGQGVVNCFA